MRILVIGCGSIGKRHIKNLLGLGVEVLACDINQGAIDYVKSAYNIPVFTDIDVAFKEKVDGVVVASTSSCHYSQTIKAMENKIPVFVEKPIASTLTEAAHIQNMARENKSILLNGFNMRFHCLISQVKSMLDKGLIGKVYSIRCISGYYLPDWHPQSDYRKSYSANKDLGGGVLLDGIHEIDYVKWFFGKVEQVFCFGGKVSNLEIDTEDLVELFMKFSNGVHAVIHINYLNRTRLREFVIIGENGIIEWDSNAQSVKIFNSNEKCWKVYQQEFEYHINDTYVKEMDHFIGCINGNEKSLNDANEGRYVLEIVECARKSMGTGMPVPFCSNV